MSTHFHLYLFALLLSTIFCGLTACQSPSSEAASSETTPDSLFLDYVWSGHPVGFALLTEPPHQFVAYYDSSRAMVVAQRRLDETQWQKKVLPETIGWDSHNYISMALDSENRLHVSGNMHNVPLVYFQATEAFDVQSLTRRSSLIGNLEKRATYPEFFDGQNGDLIFTYRDGGSGNGNQIYNRYTPQTGTWTRLLDEPLLDGQGDMNAYIHGPVLGPDQYYHLVWVWRDTPDASTNHHLSYARSKDLVHWEQSDGSPQPLPITLANGEVIDPVPPQGGMINGNTIIGFDPEGDVVVSYHKFDENGYTQIYNARRESDGWKTYPATDWRFRWDFGGRGSLSARVTLAAIENQNGMITQEYYIDSVGWQKYRLDYANLHAVEQLPLDNGYPDNLLEVRSDFPKMQVLLKKNRKLNGDTHVLRWETLVRNRDKPREGPLPDPSKLMVYYFPNGSTTANAPADAD